MDVDVAVYEDVRCQVQETGDSAQLIMHGAWFKGRALIPLEVPKQMLAMSHNNGADDDNYVDDERAGAAAVNSHYVHLQPW